MRILALLVLIAMIAAAIWLWKPELYDGMPGGVASGPAPETASTPASGSAPASAPAPTPDAPPAGASDWRTAGPDTPTDGAESSQAEPLPATSPVTSPVTSGSDVARISVAPVQAPAAVEREARSFVDTLTRVEAAPIPARKADHFVAPEQMIRLLPESATRRVTPTELARSADIGANTPITVVRSVEQIERVSPARLIADSAGNAETPVQQVLADGSIRSTTVGELVRALAETPTESVRVLREVDYFVQTTPAEIQQDIDIDRDEPLRVVVGHHGIELSKLRDLIPAEEIRPDSLFYVRTVRDTDDQGIWGIVHDGIIDNFARGIAVRRGQEITTYRVDIPRDADEVRADRRSSFLGKMIHRKSRESYVYNLRENRMGRNPDRIRPGQEIIIINFEPDELIGIYKHFVNERG